MIDEHCGFEWMRWVSSLRAWCFSIVMWLFTRGYEECLMRMWIHKHHKHWVCLTSMGKIWNGDILTYVQWRFIGGFCHGEISNGQSWTRPMASFGVGRIDIEMAKKISESAKKTTIKQHIKHRLMIIHLVDHHSSVDRVSKWWSWCREGPQNQP